MTRKSADFFQASFIHHKIQALFKGPRYKNWLVKLPKLQKKSEGCPETTSPTIHFNVDLPSISSFRGLEIPYLPLDELLATCDYISLHAPLLPSTKHMINFEKLAIMKKGIMKHGGQHETSGVTTMRFPPFARKSEWNIGKLWNDRFRKQKRSKVCLFTDYYGPLLKQMYSMSHHPFCFCLYLFFGAMELWNLSEDCLVREVAPDLFARIVNTSRGGLIDTRALIHGHFVRKKNEIARSLTMLLCHSPSWSWGLKTGVIAGAAMDVVENEAPYFFRTELRVFGTSTGWFEQWEQFSQLNSSSLRTNFPIPSHPPETPMFCCFCSLRLPSVATARNFSNSCVTDDNIAVLLRMPNVILTPHLAFFTKETILRSWLLTVQTRQTPKKENGKSELILKVVITTIGIVDFGFQCSYFGRAEVARPKVHF